MQIQTKIYNHSVSVYPHGELNTELIHRALSRRDVECSCNEGLVVEGLEDTQALCLSTTL